MPTFRPFRHQRTGIDAILKRRAQGKGMVIADQMGMGKTFTTLKTIDEACYTKNSNYKTLIICPLSLLEHWYRDSKNHLKDGNMSEYIQVYHGVGRTLCPSSRVVVTTYDVISREYNKMGLGAGDLSPLHGVNWENVVLDEAHVIRNLVTKKKSKESNHKAGVACMSLKRKFGYALTGTPFCNDITDIHSLLDFIREDRKVLDNGSSDEWILRRCKDDHLGLPLCTESVIFTDSTPEMDMYKMMYLKKGSTAAENIKIGDAYERAKACMRVVTCALRIRQLSDSPFLLPDLSVKDIGPSSIVKRSPKIAKVRELVTKYVANGQKIVIFSKFVSCLKLVYKALEPMLIPLLFTGSMSRKERDEVLTKFKRNSHNYVLLISIDCGGVGLNLTEATVVVLMEPWYNPFTELQAQNRIDRIGQTQPTTVIRLVDNSIKSADVWVRGIQQKKTEQASKLVKGLGKMTDSYQRGGDFSMRDFVTLFRNIEELKLSPIPEGFCEPHEDENHLNKQEMNVFNKITRKRNKPTYKIIEKGGKKYKVKVTIKIVNTQVFMTKNTPLISDGV